MRLLVLTPEYLPTSGGGIVTFYRHLLPALVRAGHRVTVLVGSAASAPGGEFAHDGVEVVGLAAGMIEGMLGRVPALAAAPAVRRHVAAAWAMHERARTLGAFDVVEAVDWGLLGLPWILAGEVPVHVRGHGSAGQIGLVDGAITLGAQDHLQLAIERSVFARAAGFSTYGRDNASQWTRWLGRPVEWREPALAVPRARAQGGAAWLLVLARVQRWKGPDVLAQALEKLDPPPPVRWAGRDVPDARAGTGSTLERLRRDHPMAWGQHIDVRETVPAELAAAWIGEAAAVVVPSTWDVFNFAGAEAMAAGVPVVASCGAGMSEWITPGRDGWRVPANDPAALAEALCEVASLDPARRCAIGDAARDAVAQRADPDRVAAREAQVLAGLAPLPRRDEPIDALLRPGGHAAGVDLEPILAQFPLRSLLHHGLRRVLGKVRR